MTENRTLTLDEIKSAVNLFFSDPDIQSVQPLSLGVENENYKVVLDDVSYVLRVYGLEHSHIGPRSEDDLDFELTLMKHMHDNSLPVPGIHETPKGKMHDKITTSDGERFVSIVDFVDGEVPHNFTPKMSAQISENMAKMHLLTSDIQIPVERNWPGTLIDRAAERLQKYEEHPKRESNDTTARFESIVANYREGLKQLDTSKIAQGPIHGDILYHNVVYRGEDLVGVFDFDDSRYSFFIEDFVKGLLKYFDDPETNIIATNPDNYKMYRDAYEAVRPFDSEETSALPIFLQAVAIYELSRVLYEDWDGREKPRFDTDTFLDRLDEFKDIFGI